MVADDSRSSEVTIPTSVVSPPKYLIYLRTPSAHASRAPPLDKWQYPLHWTKRDRYVEDGEPNTVFYSRPWRDQFKEELEAAGCGEKNVLGEKLNGSHDDLTNDIHPLFAKESFLLEEFDKRRNQGLWEELEPVARLATLILHSTPCMRYLRKVKFGKSFMHPVGDFDFLHYEEDEEEVELIQAANKEVLQDLAALSKKLKLVFAALKPSEGAGQIHAYHVVSQQHFNRGIFPCGNNKLLPQQSSLYHYIAINEAFRRYFMQLKQDRTASRDARTRFALATILVHEVAGHAFYARNRTDGNEEYTEPYFDYYQHRAEPELGGELEDLLFGRSINLIVNPYFGAAAESFDLRTVWVPQTRSSTGEEQWKMKQLCPHVVYPMKNAWMASWFSESTWKTLKDSDDMFHLPPSEFGIGYYHTEKVPEQFWATRNSQLTSTIRENRLEYWEEMSQAEMDSHPDLLSLAEESLEKRSSKQQSL